MNWVIDALGVRRGSVLRVDSQHALPEVDYLLSWVAEHVDEHDSRPVSVIRLVAPFRWQFHYLSTVAIVETKSAIGTDIDEFLSIA